MELNEAMAGPAFDEGKKKCPAAPHSPKGFTGKPKGEKSVPQLRSAMKKGKSTRQWNQTDTTAGNEKFEKAENLDADKQAEPDFGDDCITIAGEDYPLSIAAHHIIPGEASLPKSSLKKYLWKSEGTVKWDVGYDCDGSENGVWLPTHQVMSSALGKAQKFVIHDEENPKRTKGMSWEKLSDRAKEHEGSATSYTQLFLPRYTQQAMKLAGGQFHDSHSNYNEFVKRRLDALTVTLDKKTGGCEECKSKRKKEKFPPYLLVYKLNGLSNTMRGFLVGAPKKSWLAVYTSEFACYYARAPLPPRKLKG